MTTRALTILLSATALLACGPGPEEAHDHGPGGHAHGAAEAESWAVTAWGEHFGLFPEIDALVAGKIAGAHVHVTLLDGFAPATEGSVAVVLAGGGGPEERFTSTTAIRPGIFNVEIRPRSVGERELSFEIEAGGMAETIPGGWVRVGTSEQPGGLVRGPHELPEVDGGEEVEFLLEQQWRTSFATEWATEGALSPSATGTGHVEPPAGGEVVLTAPVDGVVRAETWPYAGQETATGHAVLSVIETVPSAHSLAELEASVRELEALSSSAGARVERLEALLGKEAVSRREVEQTRAEATGLEARLEASRSELAAAEAGRRGRSGVPSLRIRSPFAGRVSETLVSPGQQVAAGTPLVRVVRERPVWVRIALTPQDAVQVASGIAGLVLDTGASTAPVELAENEVGLVAVAPEVDALSGTVDVLIEVERSVDELRPGLMATAQILFPGEVEGIVLPGSAVVDDAGVSVVYVQLDGESFSRREVDVQQCQGSRVLVGGVLAGERVVTRGGAAIRRAVLLASGPIDGHVH